MARGKAQPAAEQVPASPPVRVEIRIGGRIRFSQDCYDTDLVMENDTVRFNAALHPTLVDVAAAPPPRPAEKFGTDPRDGDEVILQVHSGRRRSKAQAAQIAAPSPKETP